MSGRIAMRSPRFLLLAASLLAVTIPAQDTIIFSIQIRHQTRALAGFTWIFLAPQPSPRISTGRSLCLPTGTFGTSRALGAIPIRSKRLSPDAQWPIGAQP